MVVDAQTMEALLSPLLSVTLAGFSVVCFALGYLGGVRQ